MPKTENGEYELVLGNKQLLSAFFILVILFSVFFAMGFIVGKNSGGETRAGVVTGVESTPPLPGLPSEGATSAGRAGPAAGSPAPPEETKPSTEQPAAAVGTSTAAPAEAAASAAAQVEPPAKAEAKTPPVVSSVPRGESKAPAGVIQPSAGQVYLQVAATTLNEAQMLAGVLRKRGFTGNVAAVPDNPKLFRVLVGPLHDPADVAKTKSALKDIGFDSLRRAY
jgi:cell division septation protein DedD